MEETLRDFQYQPLIDVPPEVREIPLTGVECRKGTFSEAEEVFRKLRKRIDESFAEQPFLMLHFLGMIESEFLLTCCYTRPLSLCLRYLLEVARLGIRSVSAWRQGLRSTIDCKLCRGLRETEFAISLSYKGSTSS